MSRLGETADRILEQLGRESMSIDELEKKIPYADAEILDFMSREGLIELENGKVRITGFGSALLTVV